MRRRYVGVIVYALGILQHRCRGHLFGSYGGQDDRCFFSTPGISPVGLPGPEAYQADAGGLLVGGHGNCSTDIVPR